MKTKLYAALVCAVLATTLSFSARADCTLTNIGRTPLCDLGPGTYLGFQGGLYPGGLNQRPAAHEAAGVAIATTQIKPRDAAGNVDTNSGKIAILSIGMSNTTQEWATRGTANFKAIADADPAKNPKLVVVDGAQGGRDVVTWSAPTSSVWSTVSTRLGNAGVTASQVQVVWLKQVLAFPMNYTGAAFPGHAQIFQDAAAEVIRIAKTNYPNLKAVYVSCRTRCYSDLAVDGSPEPWAYETGFGNKWLVEDQLLGRNNLNYNPTNGPVVAPWISWGPYLWADGTTPRSDGLVWLCTDTADLQHPSAGGGVPKVARQLLSFFKTDPTTRPWFLKQTVTGTPPVCAPVASVTNGVAPLAVNFSANASDSGGAIRDVQWNFDDGTSSTNANPLKMFPVPGAHRVRLTVTDTDGNTTTAERLVTVAASGSTPLAITTPSPLPAGTNGVSYALTFAATGGTSPYLWTLAGGALPTGLALNTNGTLNGTPTASGAFNFTVQVADGASATASLAFSITVNAPPPTTQPWKQYLGANSGSGFNTEVWRGTSRGGYPRGANNASISSTIDPAKLDTLMATDDWINLQDGYNYRDQTAVNTFFNAVRADRGAGWRANCAQLAQAMVDGQVRNAAGGHKTYWELGNEIYADITGQTIGAWIVANNLPYPHPNSPFNDNPTHIQRVNDRGIIGYQVEYQMALALEAIRGVNATAPASHKVRILTPASTGSSINNGSATGWTATLLNYVIVGYEVEKDANGVTFTNFNKPLASSLAGRRLGDLVEIVNVHYIINANGATLNTVFNTWTGGTNHATGVFHTEEGGINAANGGRGGLSAMNNFSRALNVWLTRGLSPADARLVYYASGDGPVGTRGTDALTELHSFMPADTTVLTRKPGLLSSGAAVLETYTFENADATKRALFVLPGNNTATTLTSVTMQAGGWNWTAVAGTARVWSSVANAASTATVTRAGDGSSYTISFPSVSFTGANQQALVIFLTGSSPTTLAILTSATLPFGAVNAAYSQTLAAAGGTAPYTWSVTAGALPAGVTLSSAGVLSGTPTVVGTFNFTAQVTDGASATASRAFSVKINTVTALSFTTPATLRAGVVGAAHEDGISVTGGTAPYSQAITAGAVPGLSLGSNGLLSGTPTTAGAFTFTSTVTDAVGATASRNFSITISATGPSITTTTLPNGTVGTAYSQSLAASGGTAPYTWTVFSGALPGGLAMSSAGVISGTPAAAGTFTFAVQVTDSASATATRTLAIVINASAALAITTASPLPAGTNGTNGTNYSQAFAATGGTAPYSWSVASGALPGGLSLSGAGLLSGTPTNAGTFNFTVQVTDAASARATNSFSLTINAAPGGDGPWENFTDGSQGRTTTYVSHTGEVIPAFVRKPAGNGPFPLVLMVHGGGTSPSGTYALGRQLNPPTPQFIAAGFVIYSMDFSAVDPGNAFSTGEWELAQRAIETAQRLPYVDARRVAMVGQSHGGMVSCRSASHLDILCAVPCAPAAIDPIAAWRFQQSGGVISASLQNVINQTAANYGVPMATLAANPSAYGYRDVTDDAPTVRHPLFLVSGQNDTSSPTNVMSDYGAALTAAGKYFETYYPANGPHGFVFSAPLVPETAEFATRAVTFLNKYFSLADTDADGLPDGWELSHFNSLTNGPTDDPDGDGMSNMKEYQTGTRATQSDSHLRISSFTRGTNGETAVTFPAVAGLSYAVEFSTNLTTWLTVPAPSFVEPKTGHRQWTDNGSQTAGLAGPRFYRVRLD